MNKPAPERRLDLQDLLEALVADGLVRREATRELIIRLSSHPDPRHPLAVIAAADWDNPEIPGRKLNIETLTQWLAKRVGLPYLRIDPLSIEVSKVTSVVSYAYAARAKILPIKVTADEVVLATSEPHLREWERELQPHLKQQIRRVVSNPLDIERYLVEFYALARSVKASQKEKAANPAMGAVQNLEQLTQLGRSGKLTADDQHIVAIVDWLLQYAFEQRASDIHIEPRRDVNNIRFRIDGVLHDVYQTPTVVGTAVTSRIKILARMDVAEKRRPQDGRIKSRTPDGKEVELRVSSLPTAFGEKMVLRIFDPDVLVKDFGDLGFAGNDGVRWQNMIDQPHGIILVTGPTGSGKTTTLYSTLRHLATPEVNVCTIEDPIELVEPAFNQMQVQPVLDLTFAAGVRALMRQDPDIIMVGEVRDLETAEVAIQAALTGHLVLSTLHTNDAPAAVTRLLDLGVPSYLIRSTLLGVVAQRLLRKLCKHCKKPVPTDPAAWQALVGGQAIDQPRQVHEATGCLECRETGYLGRTGIYEMLTLTPEVKEMIRDDADPVLLREAALRSGMMPLRIAGSQKVWTGVTSIDEVLRTTPSLTPFTGREKPLVGKAPDPLKSAG
ncbi:type II/IV secretion system protein [Solimonas sp. K1W22B-7]|uniref:GspE/PulE family protein n=1 Tax=Solimonas sp. K1W22B-7 TaxID=2303331 RepID=UPI000E32F99F|nr:GspE/PulE family protein [Solimonas sp. K1W22B-7]AXQ28808.1 type II/IV secretion system protein [Solimonas sp. K1W22B-7]